MGYREILILIPSHSLEDFPTDLAETEAAGLLNAFAVAWHPRLLVETGSIPTWHRSDEPPGTPAEQIVIVPSVCEGWLPHHWADDARLQGALIVESGSDRALTLELLLAGLADANARGDSAEGPPPEAAGNLMNEATLEPRPDSIVEERSVAKERPETPEQRPEPTTLNDDLTRDFLALGTCYLQCELLTRHMHHFSNLDEGLLRRSALAAARALLNGDDETCRTQLRAAFDVLTTARERFYPVDCYLLDLCLLIPRLADKHLTALLQTDVPFNLVVSARDLEQIAESSPETVTGLRESCQAGRLEVCGGEYAETMIPLVPVESVLFDFRRGRDVFQNLLGTFPTVWARRRFGLSPFLPQVLERFGYKAGLHFLLDDGIYPDAEYSRFRWEGWSGNVIDGISRIPLAADSATSWLRFPARMAESMQDDQSAALVLARWPELTTPWLEDLRRMSKYSPALGRFATMGEFLEYSDSPGRSGHYEAHEYLSPVLTHAVALREADPVSRFTRHFDRRRRLDAALWYDALTSMLQSRTVQSAAADAIELRVETASRPEITAPDSTSPDSTGADHDVDGALAEFARKAEESLAKVLLHGAGEQAGYLVLNSLSFARTEVVEFSPEAPLPSVGGAVQAVCDEDSRRFAIIELPPCGYAWLPARTGAGSAASQSAVPLAEGNWLRNEIFEVEINEVTGGIRRVKQYGRKPNRLSQQLALRFPRERTVAGEDPDDGEKTYYSEMQLTSLQVTSRGPTLGEIVSRGVLCDPADGTVVAEYRQSTRLWRGLPWLEIEIELTPSVLPEGDPWSNFYASRFAWNDSTASLTRSLLEVAQPLQNDRSECPHYVEIAGENERTTIVTLGQSFFRKTGLRMLDGILLVAGESQRRFRYRVVLDEPYPMRAALSAMTPPAVVPVTNGPPLSGASAWLLHVDSPGVQLTRVLDLPSATRAVESTDSATTTSAARGYVVRLMETEGRRRTVNLQCFRTPVKARQCDLQGKQVTELLVHSDQVRLEMSPYELADVELLFAEEA